MNSTNFKVIALVGKSGAGKDYLMHQMAEENGYKDIAEFEKLQPGDKVYFINRL